MSSTNASNKPDKGGRRRARKRPLGPEEIKRRERLKEKIRVAFDSAFRAGEVESQSDFARQMDAGTNRVSDWLNPGVPLDDLAFHTMTRIGRVANVSLDWFGRDDDSPPEPPPDETERRILALCRRIGPERVGVALAEWLVEIAGTAPMDAGKDKADSTLAASRHLSGATLEDTPGPAEATAPKGKAGAKATAKRGRGRPRR